MSEYQPETSIEESSEESVVSQDNIKETPLKNPKPKAVRCFTSVLFDDSNSQLNSEKRVKNSTKVKGEGKRKPTRLCVFCNNFQSRLTRHLKTVHRNEKEIQDILKMHPKKQVQEFERLRKKGIMKYNLEQLVARKSPSKLERERRTIGKASKLKMCSHCKAFVQARYFFKHKRRRSQICTSDESAEKTSTRFCSGVTPDLLRKIDEKDDNEFFDLLNRFVQDEIGTLCQNNDFIITFGQYLFKKNRKRKAKSTETRKTVMQNMRTFAGLFIKFKDIALSIQRKY